METLIAYGGAVKSAGSAAETPDLVPVAGWLVSFAGADLTQEYFTGETDFGRPLNEGDSMPMNLYYAHGQDSEIGKKSVGTGSITRKAEGLWYEGQVKASDAYGKMIAKLAADGKLGLSSGAAAHLVERKAIKGVQGAWLSRWCIAEASLTPEPAEPRNGVTTLQYVKSLLSVKGAAENGIFDAAPCDAVSSLLQSLSNRLLWAVMDEAADGDADGAVSLITQFADAATRQVVAIIGAGATPVVDAAKQFDTVRAGLRRELLARELDVINFGMKG